VNPANGSDIDRCPAPSRRFLGGLLLLFAFVFLLAPSAHATIRYEISLAQRQDHLIQVRMHIPKAMYGTVAMPAWNALYQIRDFASRVRDVMAVGMSNDGTSGGNLPVLKLDKQTWQVGNPKGYLAGKGFDELVVSYSIEWNDPSPFDTQLNSHHAFINFAEILLYVPDRTAEDTAITFSHVPSEWKIFTALSPSQTEHAFTAPSYDALVDAPAEAGTFGEFEFDNEGAHFRVAVDSKNGGAGRMETYLRQITSYELKLMGGAPFKEYTFLFHIGPYEEVGGGGMEHSNSTAIAAPSAEDAAGIAAHEFFHAWNVKRIRPQALEPVDYSKEQYTRALWFAEGVTSTYAAYALERTKLQSKDQFYEGLAAQITTLESRPAHLWQSAEEASLETWFDKYDPYNRPERSISYYNKGQILGVLLDLGIRDATDNRKSLDDVLRRMNEEYARQGKFYDESDGIRAVIEEAAGKSFEDFFRRYVAGVDEIPYDNFFSLAGLTLKNDAVASADLSFAPGTPISSGLPVSSVEPGGPAEGAGLREDDIILALDGKAFPANPAVWLRDHSPGETTTLRVLRDGREIDISYPLGSREGHHYSISEVARPTDRQRRIREGILRGVTD
jgi:predicted metalloprotease with PDZ domain